MSHGVFWFRASKAVLPAAVACLMLASDARGDQVALPTVSATPGTRVVFPVAFTSQAGSVAGLQFDLEYDSSAMSLAVVEDEAIQRSGKSLYQADLAPNKKRFLVVGLNQTPIPNGTLVNLLVYLNPSASPGSYPLTLSALVATDPSGLAELLTGANGVLVATAATGVVNGASLLPGPVAASEIVSLIGPFGAETGVLFDGAPAPLFSAAPGTIAVTVPLAVSGKTATRMQVTSGGRVIAELTLPAAETAPGIFTLNSSGIGPAAALNEGPTLNSPSNPAARGSTVALFATGTGQNSPASVRIGGANAEVLSAGAAPAFPAGVDLVICRIPANAASGSAVPVVIQAGTASSQPGVTLAVR